MRLLPCLITTTCRIVMAVGGDQMIILLWSCPLGKGEGWRKMKAGLKEQEKALTDQPMRWWFEVLKGVSCHEERKGSTKRPKTEAVTYPKKGHHVIFSPLSPSPLAPYDKECLRAGQSSGGLFLSLSLFSLLKWEGEAVTLKQASSWNNRRNINGGR